MLSILANSIFQEVITNYHIADSPDQVFHNIYNSESEPLEFSLYKKCWIDTVQWHYEDLIRDPNINPYAALSLKRKIDKSNQDRTDMVEYIDDFFLNKFKNVIPSVNAKINSESPAWAIDRLSILSLKIYHMQEEVNRTNAGKNHVTDCSDKLSILLEQRNDLSTAIDDLLNDIETGKKFMKVYKQMKMYNDNELNPVLREQA